MSVSDTNGLKRPESPQRFVGKRLPRWAIFLFVWGAVAAGFVALRSATIFVWSDTPYITANLYEEPEPVLWGKVGTWDRIVSESFSGVGGDGYRPLARFLQWTGVPLVRDPLRTPGGWLWMVGILLGGLTVAFFGVARRFLNSDAAGWVAVALFILSAPVLTGLYPVFAIQVTVPLLICSGLLCYWKWLGPGNRRGWYLAGLLVICLLGPWFREFVGILPVLVIALELSRARKPTLVACLSGIFLLHALFPTALVHWIAKPELPIVSVFEMGHLGRQVHGPGVSSLWETVRNAKWEMPRHFLVLFPPTLLLMACAFLLVQAARAVRSATGERQRSGAVAWRLPEPGMRFRFLRGAVLLLFIAVAALGTVRDWRIDWLPFWLSLGFAVIGLYRHGFLAFWLLLSFLPFMKVFSEQVHLAYVLLPAVILLVAALEELYERASALRRGKAAVRAALTLGIAIGLCDHALNLYAVHRVMRGINGGILVLSEWFRRHVPPGTVVITNALHGEDIRLFSGNHIRIFWTVRAGIARDAGAVADPAELERLLKDSEGRRDVYFLDMDYDYPAHKAGYHAHKYVRDRSVAYEKAGIPHVTRVRYPYLDPLRSCTSRSYLSFLGSPDLENDFYRGPAQDGTPFLREVYVEYHLYKVTGTEVDPWDSNGPLKTVQEGYRGFNLLELNGRFFAIPQGEGSFMLRKVWRNEYSRSFVSDRREDLIRQVDASAGAPPVR